ncbi:hypothetical protein Vadar_030389 [Vaccinium darrowii]|uniref:Uncharacterized protein n=1 Tax=Vaccinium darrowii TaxID=229202 RepID=A0ACB7XV38_9ERIC|nr:hypothetical protein Vadar_030389 [Vaccinium darrowii]
MLSLIIPGLSSLSNDIDVYLQLLIEELKELWEVGIDIHDISSKENFQMRAAAFWTMHDLPGYVMCLVGILKVCSCNRPWECQVALMDDTWKQQLYDNIRHEKETITFRPWRFVLSPHSQLVLPSQVMLHGIPSHMDLLCLSSNTALYSFPYLTKDNKTLVGEENNRPSQSYGASQPSQSCGASWIVQPQVPLQDPSPNFSQPQQGKDGFNEGDELNGEIEVGIRVLATVNRDHYAELVDFWFSDEGKAYATHLLLPWSLVVSLFHNVTMLNSLCPVANKYATVVAALHVFSNVAA